MSSRRRKQRLCRISWSAQGSHVNRTRVCRLSGQREAQHRNIRSTSAAYSRENSIRLWLGSVGYCCLWIPRQWFMGSWLWPRFISNCREYTRLQKQRWLTASYLQGSRKTSWLGDKLYLAKAHRAMQASQLDLWSGYQPPHHLWKAELHHADQGYSQSTHLWQFNYV